ncbi:MAG: hypothetical protein NT033_01155, partial [Candidatus Omnitrophica bacterium]|nr:hypothetical protein [Candidatus Omnitrophota bacterium]
MKRKSISKIIEIYLLAGIFALQGIGPVARPAYAAKASSQNALRLAHSLEVIQGYLGEVKKVIAEANDDAGKEYIAETVLKELNRTSPSPLEYLKSDPGTKEFKVFADKVSKARGEYNQSGDASGVYLFTLAMVNGLFPGRMLYLSKAKESPFPNEGASAWYMALQARNTKIVVALNAYLEAIDKKMTSLLTKNDGVVSDKSYAELSKVANEVALFSWNLSKTITLYKLIQAQKRYKRANEFYAAFVAYSEACSSLFSEFGDYTEATMPGIKNSEQHFYWSETTVHAGPVLRTGWYNFSCKTMTTVYVKALNGSSWYIWQGSGGSGSNQSYFEQDYAGISGKVDLAASEREMREYVSNLDQYSVDWPNIPDFEATILAKYMGYLEECDKAYDNKLAEVNKLVKELNSILNKYRKDFPYETPFSVAIIDEQSGAFYGIPISFTEGYNRFPQPVPGTYPPVKIPEKVVLDAKASSDPDKDKLNYRWVITGIPKWPQAKSKKYVLYQKLTDSQTA